jgi:hypothetical protein
MMGWRSVGPAFRAALARRLDRVEKVLTGVCTDKAKGVRQAVSDLTDGDPRASADV